MMQQTDHQAISSLSYIPSIIIIGIIIIIIIISQLTAAYQP